MCSRRATLAVGLALLCGSAVEAAQPPPRLPASPRYFGRAVRSVTPGTAVTLQTGHVWGARVDGVAQEQLTVGVEGEVAWRGLGVFFSAPLQLDIARTEGVYGAGQASVAGAADLRFGLDLRLRRWESWGARWTLGAGARSSAPTGGARAVYPDTPHIGAPRHVFGPAKWTASTGAALAVELREVFTMQLNLDLIGHFRDLRDHPVEEQHWLFAAVAASTAYQLLPWLVALLQIDLQLELFGRGQRRQLLFIGPALRFLAGYGISVDAGLRAPVRQESSAEHRFSVGASLRLALPNLPSSPGSSTR
jgi:hypothetical protein